MEKSNEIEIQRIHMNMKITVIHGAGNCFRIFVHIHCAAHALLISI